jgi:tight adherence protein B
MTWRRVIAVFVVLATSVIASPAGAQDGSVRIERVRQADYPQIEVLVSAPALPDNQRLPKDAFTVTEDGEVRSRSIEDDDTTSEADVPSVVLVIDVSGSMEGDPIIQARAAADRFMQQLPEGTEVGIVTFGDTAQVISPFTTDLDLVRAELSEIDIVDPDTGTALYDGTLAAVDMLSDASNDVRSIVLLSDGNDTASTAPANMASRAVRRASASIAAVALESGQSAPEQLEDLVGNRGDVVPASAPEELAGIYSGLATEVSTRYLLQYDSEASGRTELGIAIDWPGINASTTRSIAINGAPAEPAADGPAGGPALATYTVTVPVLATTPAFAAGLVAFAVGTLILLLLALSPRRASTRLRLSLDLSGSNRPRLTSIAQRTVEAADRRLRKRGIAQRLDRTLEQAGLDIRPGELVIFVGSAMMVAYAVGLVLANQWLALLMALVIALGTRLYLSNRRDKRQAAFSDQLTDVLQLISGSLRAGYGLLQGVDAVTRDADEPAAGEFRRILVEHRLGRDLNDAMDNCAERMDNSDFAWVVQAFNIHRDVGGDLARVLDNIIATVRERTDVHRQVRALSAEGRMSAIVLTALPIVVFFVIQVSSPDYMAELVGRPFGLVLIGVAVLMLILGSLWIRRLVKVRY